MKKVHQTVLQMILIVSLTLGIVMIGNAAGSIVAEPAEYMVVVSIDALQGFDAEYLRGLSHFRFLFDEGSYAKEVVGVYPSVTYPSHASIITGTYPKTHGITDNMLFTPGLPEKEIPWFWQDKWIKVPTLYEIAKKARLKVGALFWPVTAGARIDYNCPEIWPVKKGENQILLSLTSGSLFFLLDIEMRFGKMRDGQNQPNLDNFTAAAATHMIRTRKPNLVLIHFTDLDHVRHMYGTRSAEATASLTGMNDRFGQIVQATKDAGIYEKTVFVVLGDHGFADYQYHIALNTLFVQEGLITVNDKGAITDWQAYAHSSGGSAQIVLKNPADTTLRDRVYTLLQNLIPDESNGIAAVYTQDEAAKKGLAGNFEFVVEARTGYYLTLLWTGAYRTVIDRSQAGSIEVASHGYDPERPDFRTFFITAGPGVKQGVVLDSIQLIDEAPTMAALLGLEMPEAEGRILEEILE